jgi:hypothetical protein
MKRFTTVAVALLLLMAGCSSSDPTASDEYVAPEELTALIDNWYAANDRADGSDLDLYVPEGYHLYGDQRIEYDEIPAHLSSGGLETEWITEPLLIAEDEDGRYVVVRGMRILGSWSNASALLFEIVTTADDELRLVQTAWFYDNEWSAG